MKRKDPQYHISSHRMLLKIYNPYNSQYGTKAYDVHTKLQVIKHSDHSISKNSFGCQPK